MAEMTAREYLKQRGRMTHNCDISCIACSLSRDNNSKKMCCGELEGKYPEEAISIVQEWAEKHPVKTMLQDFFEKHPNAPRKTSGDPICCIVTLGYETDKMECHKSCLECWNRPLEE